MWFQKSKEKRSLAPSFFLRLLSWKHTKLYWPSPYACVLDALDRGVCVILLVYWFVCQQLELHSFIDGGSTLLPATAFPASSHCFSRAEHCLNFTCPAACLKRLIQPLRIAGCQLRGIEEAAGLTIYANCSCCVIHLVSIVPVVEFIGQERNSHPSPPVTTSCKENTNNISEALPESQNWILIITSLTSWNKLHPIFYLHTKIIRYDIAITLVMIKQKHDYKRI
jgi:hypothetical protein